MSAVSQKSFSGGEIAPALQARTDQSKYANGLKACRNFIVMRHGGVTNRTGTKYLGEVKDSSKTVRLIPFIFNATQTYILEFGDEYVRFIKNGAYLKATGLGVVSISTTTPPVVNYSGADPTNGDIMFSDNFQGACASFYNNRYFKVSAVNAGTDMMSLQSVDGVDIDASTYPQFPSSGAFISSGGSFSPVYTLTSPYDHLDLPDLRFVQSGDTITITHPSYAPRILVRTSDTSWAFTTITFAPTIAAPTSVTNNGTAGTVAVWVVTAEDLETGEESYASSSTGANALPTTAAPLTVSWTASAGVLAPYGGITGTVRYHVYKAINGVYGFIGSAEGTAFIDTGIAPDVGDNPPTARNPFPSTNNYPTCVAYHQQRLMFGNSNNEPESIWGSKTGSFYNFSTHSPILSDDSVTFAMFSKQVNFIQHMLTLSKLLIFTTGGEWTVEGDSSGILTPMSINPRQFSAGGSGTLAPLIVNDTALYSQSRGTIIRDLAADSLIDGLYKGNDLTIFAAHLFDNTTLVDWAYQQIPHSVVWVVRSDGSVVGLTYLKDHQIAAWHRHDFYGGLVKNVCSVPESDEDAVYFVVKRTVGSGTKRYVERMANRMEADGKDLVFLDSAVTWDGRNTSATYTVTLSGGSTWDSTELLTLTVSHNLYTFNNYTRDIGNGYELTGSDGEVLRFTIVGITSVTAVTGYAERTVPTSLRTTATSTFTKIIKNPYNLWHLEGKTVSVIGDGAVEASVNNADYPAVTVSQGVALLSQRYGVIHIGLQITSDIETLNIDTAQGESMSGRNKDITKVTIMVDRTRGVWIGGSPPSSDATDPLEGLTELKTRDQEDYGLISESTGTVDVNIRSEWNSNGRLFIRQVDPLPCSILSIVPTGFVPYPRGGS